MVPALRPCQCKHCERAGASRDGVHSTNDRLLSAAQEAPRRRRAAPATATPLPHCCSLAATLLRPATRRCAALHRAKGRGRAGARRAARRVRDGAAPHGRGHWIRSVAEPGHLGPHLRRRRTNWPAAAPVLRKRLQALDENDDAQFYPAQQPRREVYHIDEGAVAALTSYYKREIKPGSDALDICVLDKPCCRFFSWSIEWCKTTTRRTLNWDAVAGTGMNERELRPTRNLRSSRIRIAASTSTPSTRRLLDGVGRAIDEQGPATDALVDFNTGRGAT